MQKKLLILFCSVIALLYLLESLYNKLLQHNMNLKSSYLFTQKIDADVLILGDCVPLLMLPPDNALNMRTYNLSTNHSSYADNLIHYNFYLKNNKAPRYLLLYIANKTLDGSFNIFNPQYFSQYSSDSVYRAVCKQEMPGYYIFSLFPFLKYALIGREVNFNVLQGFKHWYQGRALPYDTMGYSKLRYMDWDFYFERFIAKYPKGRKFKWNEKEVGYLRSIVALAKASGTEVILFSTPVYPAALPYFLNEADIQKKIQDFANKQKIKYWNFAALFPDADRKYFATIFNTNERGSIEFRDALVQRFKESLLYKIPGKSE